MEILLEILKGIPLGIIIGLIVGGVTTALMRYVGSIGAVRSLLLSVKKLLLNIEFVRNIVMSVQPTNLSDKNLDQLKKEYEKWTNYECLIGIVFIVSIGYVLWKSMTILYNYRIYFLEESKYLIAQSKITWVMISTVLSMFFSMIPLHFTLLYLLGAERYAEFREYSGKHFGYNGIKIVEYMAMVIVPVCFVCFILSMNCYTRVTEQSFIINRFWGIGEKTYPFAEIDSIKLIKSFKAPIGNIVRINRYIITFHDSSDYNFDKTPHDLSYEQQTEIVKYVSRKASKEILIEDPYPEEPNRDKPNVDVNKGT